MKILHIIDSGGLHGAEMVLLNLVGEQIKLGLDPTIASIGGKNIPDKPIETEAVKRGFKVKRFRMRSGPNYLGALKILGFAQKEAFDLMHSHGYKGNILFGFIPKKFRKLPLVATLHGWTSTDGITKMRLYVWLDVKSLEFIDAVVLVNKGMLSNPKLRNCKGINPYVVNNGIPLLDFHSASQLPKFANPGSAALDQTIVDFCTGGYTIGAIGRLSTEKGHAYLVDAVNLLIKKDMDIRLIIIGEGYERRKLERIIEEFGLKEKVLLPKYKENASSYLPYLKIFVLSSLTEGLPITILEAMQAKIPIVATRVGGIPEVLQNGRGGLLVEPGSSKNLAEAISNIYHDPKLAKDLASVSYQEAVTKYTSETMASQYLDIYQKFIKHNNLSNPTDFMV